MHGVGVSVVNALSEWLELTIWRNEKKHQMVFRKGEAENRLREMGHANGEAGTQIKFMPSDEIFSNINFDFNTLERRLRELAFLNSGVRIQLIDKRNVEEKKSEFYFDGGLKAFVDWLNRSQSALHDTLHLETEKEEVTVEFALAWTDSFYENTLCFTNNIPCLLYTSPSPRDA